VIEASLQVSPVVFPLATATSICRNRLTICSGECFFSRAIPGSSHTSLSHSHWYKICRAEQVFLWKFLPPGALAWKAEHGVEFNTLLHPLPMLLFQPVIQYYANVGGGVERAVVFGFRTKVEF
jgi:hypothetical protein